MSFLLVSLYDCIIQSIYKKQSRKLWYMLRKFNNTQSEFETNTSDWLFGHFNLHVNKISQAVDVPSINWHHLRMNIIM